MSNVYIWQFTDNYRVFEGSDESNDLYLEKGKLAQFSGEWTVPVLVNANEKGVKKKVGDFPATTGFCHLLSSRAVDCLSDVIKNSGTLYEVEISDDDIEGKFYLFRCDRVADCLDRENSILKFSPIRPDELVIITEPKFFPEKLPDDGFFVVPEKIDGHIYATEKVKERVKKNKLKGFVLMDKMFGGKSWIS